MALAETTVGKELRPMGDARLSARPHPYGRPVVIGWVDKAMEQPMPATNAHSKQISQASAQVHRQALMKSLQERAHQARRNGDIPAQQALYREAVALGLPLDCLDP